jgi:3,4-dihydroxy 2-butanone 4-phosphate synthase / GTP cyclohydrolase II
LVRVHEPLSVFDLLDSTSCTHSWNALNAMQAIANAECGVMILLHHTENGDDVIERIQHADEPIRYNQELRTYGIGSQILLDLGVRKMRLLATPRKMPSMMGFGLETTGYYEAS